MVSVTNKFRFLLTASSKTNGFVSFVGIVPMTRLASTSAKKSFSGNVSLITTRKERLFVPEKRPILLLYCWLLAKDNHIKHYSDLYGERGFDVLQVKVLPQDVLWPKFIEKTVAEISQFLVSNPERPLLVHGFSVGGFVHMEVLQHLFNLDQKSKSEEALNRFKGQIFDSVVDIIGVAEGVSTALFQNQRTLKKLTCASINGYLKLTEKSVASVHLRASEIFHSNNLRIPTLMLYSKCDPIGSPGPIEAAIENWKEKNILVMSKCWPDSPHVGHFRKYRDEYVKSVDNFLKNIGLLSHSCYNSNIEHIPSGCEESDMSITQVSEKAIDTPSAKSEEFVQKRKVFASHKSGI